MTILDSGAILDSGGGPGPRTSQAALWDQITERRAPVRGYDAREDLIAQLLEANQNLVLATINAQNLRDEAEASNQRQNEFLAMLAHELRNPLAPISGAAALIGKTPDASPQLGQLQAIIGRQAGHLSRLLDDLLDAARINSGKISLRVQSILLADVLERAVEAVQPALDARRQRLILEAPPGAVGIDGDHVRLTQVFSNLLANAAKFTPEGGCIRVVVTALAQRVEVAVSDNGAGISAHLLPHIFDLFTQGSRSPARTEGGLGIGLSIVRNIVQMHRGTVTAGSAGPGCGSVFLVTLPTVAPCGCAAAPDAHPACPTCTILLVDDNADASETLQLLLELDLHKVSTAPSARAALAMVQDDLYDVVICDIGMPEMSGIELARILRASARGRQPLLLGLSGYGQPQDRADAIAAGFDGYFVKPVDPDALTAAIAAHCAARGQARSA
ncbi:two-component system, sensor histidine kinase [Janthinobacterium sp. CG_23.3]|uniref:hybrid sensor histidine kinase/response regulator n=1 Tax=unclassified Janthinobacterium TaxID=2610881 RepID=UPI00034A9169|nr:MULTISPECIES: hybrid sensor histidine kinase/response regulator [unclassified Janthinobacterium]MEC5161554.1 signal transduction histidine kinase/ActR/RegA family two-component response regulator [Janthinobacterium sp. CG_S6]